MNRKETLTFSGGLSGLIAVLGLCLYNLSCLAIIFFTAKSEGQGDTICHKMLKAEALS